MPCRDDRDDCPPDHRDNEISSLGSELQLTKLKLNQVTRLLCHLCKEFGTAAIKNDKIAKELCAWYTEHAEFDEQRLTKARASGLKKLTEDEKEALGLT